MDPPVILPQFEAFNYDMWFNKFTKFILDYRYFVYFMNKYNKLAKEIINHYQDFVILNQISPELRGQTVNQFLYKKLKIRADLLNALKTKFDKYYKESNDIKTQMNQAKKDLENETNVDIAKSLILNVASKLKTIEPGLEKDKLSPSTQDFYSSMKIENIIKEKHKIFIMGKDALTQIDIDSFFEYDKHYKFLDNLEEEFKKNQIPIEIKNESDPIKNESQPAIITLFLK
jgi:hypothetical protein